MLCGHHRTEAFALERDCPTFVRSRLSRNVLFQLAHLNGRYCLRHSNALSPCCADFHRHSHLLSLLVELLVNEKVSSDGPWALYEVWVCRTKKSAYLPRCKSLTRRFFFYQTDFVSYKSEGNGEVHSPGQETNWKWQQPQCWNCNIDVNTVGLGHMDLKEDQSTGRCIIHYLSPHLYHWTMDSSLDCVCCHFMSHLMKLTLNLKEMDHRLGLSITEVQ